MKSLTLKSRAIITISNAKIGIFKMNEKEVMEFQIADYVRQVIHSIGEDPDRDGF